MRRYCVLIPEAVQLVMHAAALAKGGEVFVPDEEIPIGYRIARRLVFAVDSQSPATDDRHG